MTTPDYPMTRAAGCPFAPPERIRELTAGEPISRVRIWDGSTPWLITRHADQKQLLADPRVSIDEHRPGFPHMTAGRAATVAHIPPMITNTDPPEHTRLRRLVNGPFMIKKIEALRPDLQRLIDELIDDLLAGPRPADLVTAFGLAVPTVVITRMLGVPYEDHEFFQRNSNVTVSHSATPEEAMAASGALARYLGDLIDKRRTEPLDDVVSQMATKINEGGMSRDEAVHMGVAMLIAGHETTANMISLGTLALLQNPAQLALLRETEDPAVVAAAVEELLRYLTIVHTGVRRIAAADIEFGDQVIRAGDGLVFDLSAADWDAGVYPEPERLDLTRPARNHLAFGSGVHQCLGQALARVELQVVFSTLYRRLPGLRLAVPEDEISFAYEGVAYGLHSLPVTW